MSFHDRTRTPMTAQKEYGDFQTPEDLANRVTVLVSELFGTPDFVMEPTVGRGAFLEAAARRWGNAARYEGYDVNSEYVNVASERLQHVGAKIQQRDFFLEDWNQNLSRPAATRPLIIGNPPWVTNAGLGRLGSSNLPQKSNFQRLRGLDARTGKSNFDIAESMLIRLIEALPQEGAIAMLCKTMTARKVLRHVWKTDAGREGARLFRIDAKAEFDVAVDACLFFVTGIRTGDRTAQVYAALDEVSESTRFGLVDGDLVANVDAYRPLKHLAGRSSAFTWRSGVKHDAAKIMEFTRDGDRLVNGYGETVQIEQDYVYPLLKSSDLGNGRADTRKAVLVTQQHTGDDTHEIKEKAPRTWAYLMRHRKVLDGRKSSIYKKRPRFCVFGIGPYSFSPWKIAISGLHPQLSFVVVPPCDGRPVMVDDTCYQMACGSQEEAELISGLLCSAEASEFLNALIFKDSKRPITIDVLSRLSLVELARRHGKVLVGSAR
jgi:hypothetical protein